MKKMKTFSFGVVMCLMVNGVWAPSARAQFAEDALRFSQFGLGVGGRWLGLGSITVGVADDYSALFSNPAGLAILRSYEFSVGASYLGFRNEVEYLNSTKNSYKGGLTMNSLGLAIPVPTSRGSLTFALGFGRMSDFTQVAEFGAFNTSSSIVQSLLNHDIVYDLYLAGVDTATNLPLPYVRGNVDQRVTVREGGGMNHWSFGGAVDIAPNLSLGGSISYVSGSYEYDREFVETDTRNFYNGPPPDDFDQFVYINSIKSSISGVNGIIGLMFRRHGFFRLGVSFRTPSHLWISEDFVDRGVSLFDAGSPDPGPYEAIYPGKTEYEIVTPAVISAGGSLTLFDWFILGADIEYTDWTQMRFENGGVELQDENRIIKGIYKATTNARVGAELALLGLGLRFRAGLMYKPSPYKGDPPEFDQIYATAGVGLRLESGVMLHGAYGIGFWQTFRNNYSLPNMPDASRTKESVLTDNVTVSLAVRF